MDNTRAELRRRLRSGRRALDELTQREASLAVAATLEDAIQASPPAVAAAYIATDGELSPEFVVAQLRSLGVPVAFPLISDDTMSFHIVDDASGFVQGQWGLVEPEPTAALVEPRELELVLTPLVGFDDKLNRIGRGKACYDRYFSFLSGQPRPALPRLIGLAHDLQRLDALIAAPHDVTLNAVVTATTSFGTIVTRTSRTRG